MKSTARLTDALNDRARTLSLSDRLTLARETIAGRRVHDELRLGPGDRAPHFGTSPDIDVVT